MMIRDRDRQPDPDINDTYMRLVARVAQLVGGKLPEGTQAGSPPGSPGLPPGPGQPNVSMDYQQPAYGAQMPGGPAMSRMHPGPAQMPQGAEMQQMPPGGQSPFASPGGGPQQMPATPTGTRPGDPRSLAGPGASQEPYVPGEPGPQDWMGRPSPRGPMDTMFGPNTASEYHTPTPQWQQPMPGGGPQQPQNPNPGQPFASYKIGDHPWMTRPMVQGDPSAAQSSDPQTRNAGYRIAGEAVPADMSPRNLNPQGQAQQQPQQEEAQASSGRQLPQVPAATTPQQAERYLRQLYPHETPQNYRHFIPQAIQELDKKNAARYELESKGYKDRLTNDREERLHQSASTRIDTAVHNMKMADEREARATNEKTRRAAAEDRKYWQREHGQAVAVQSNLMALGNLSPEGKVLMQQMQAQQAGAAGKQRETEGEPAGQARPLDLTSTGQASDQPPMEGARKAPDGQWYVQKGSKYYRVGE